MGTQVTSTGLPLPRPMESLEPSESLFENDPPLRAGPLGSETKRLCAHRPRAVPFLPQGQLPDLSEAVGDFLGREQLLTEQGAAHQGEGLGGSCLENSQACPVWTLGREGSVWSVGRGAVLGTGGPGNGMDWGWRGPSGRICFHAVPPHTSCPRLAGGWPFPSPAQPVPARSGPCCPFCLRSLPGDRALQRCPEPGPRGAAQPWVQMTKQIWVHVGVKGQGEEDVTDPMLDPGRKGPPSLLPWR